MCIRDRRWSGNRLPESWPLDRMKWSSKDLMYPPNRKIIQAFHGKIKNMNKRNTRVSIEVHWPTKHEISECLTKVIGLLSQISSLAEVKFIFVSESQFKDHQYAELSKFVRSTTTITSLTFNVQWSRITDEGMYHLLSGLPCQSLQELNLAYSNYHIPKGTTSRVLTFLSTFLRQMNSRFRLLELSFYRCDQFNEKEYDVLIESLLLLTSLTKLHLKFTWYLSPPLLLP
eukprot:TRINITY_DN9151_c0_g2_i1.p1 TRINITY_DN9151_c0_g2~~TRINITY_DN9151_c0_g2_i1.p1  ORF type:complete len:248 (-),score=23.33 TRINITY_DN9151_c0_g2_i1:255-941(-)